jgi:hypothetical protein
MSENNTNNISIEDNHLISDKLGSVQEIIEEKLLEPQEDKLSLNQKKKVFKQTQGKWRVTPIC